MSDDVLLARAFLSRVFEPAYIPAWKMVRELGPVDAAAAVRSGQVDDRTSEAVAARAASVDVYADLDAGERHGLRLVVPESDEWPHFAFAALEVAAERRLREYEQGAREHSPSGELIPPLALWIRGTSDLATVGFRSVAIVGARAASPYGEGVAKQLAYELGRRDVLVVSGGAHGIDTAAHRGALAAGAETVLVSAGGLDRAYPPANAGLFERVAECGLLVSEGPPGTAPQRRRFLTRNRLIAALGTGTVVVEAAARSGAANTASHCVGLGRPRMAVPGPVTSRLSVGCHRLINAERNPARLVTSADDVLATIGSPYDLSDGLAADDQTQPPLDAGAGSASLTARLDALDEPCRRVFDGFPARGWIGTDRLVLTTGLAPLAVIRALPTLELAGLVETGPHGYRISPAVRVRTPGADM